MASGLTRDDNAGCLETCAERLRLDRVTITTVLPPLQSESENSVRLGSRPWQLC